jgi:hypothetical protein
MEAAPADVGGASDPAIKWCSNTTTLIAGTFGTAIGTGETNTNAMLAGSPAACTTGAAVSARAYTGGGKNDWFLPSKDELNELYPQRTTVGGFAAESYWSSSQGVKFYADYAWLQNFGYGGQLLVGKVNSKLVRPVRAF